MGFHRKKWLLLHPDSYMNRAHGEDKVFRDISPEALAAVLRRLLPVSLRLMKKYGGNVKMPALTMPESLILASAKRYLIGHPVNHLLRYWQAQNLPEAILSAAANVR